MRDRCRALMDRLRAHCDQLGMNPPDSALRRYATLRHIESCWWLAGKMTEERLELLEELAERLHLDTPAPGTTICSPDLADSIWRQVDPSAYARWDGQVLMISMRDLQ